MDIVNAIQNICLFLYVWVSIFLLHEVMHLFEAWRQTGEIGSILVNFNAVTLRAGPREVHNMDLFLLAGGLYAGIISIVIGFLIGHPILSFLFYSVGLTNIVYSFFEMKYLGEVPSEYYLCGRYSIYFCVMAVCILVRFSGWFM